MIKLYSKPACIACMATQKELERQEVEYEYIDITKDEIAHATVIGLGYMSMPVVIDSKGNHWSGFRPDKIKGLR